MASHQANGVMLFIYIVLFGTWAGFCLYIVKSPQQVGHSLFRY